MTLHDLIPPKTLKSLSNVDGIIISMSKIGFLQLLFFQEQLKQGGYRMFQNQHQKWIQAGVVVIKFTIKQG